MHRACSVMVALWRDLLADDAQQQALEERIAEALTHKKQTHFLHQGNTGITQNLSYIGG
ncbi:hypothetical protein ACNKHO_04810 [Shigella flexneri]